MESLEQAGSATCGSSPPSSSRLPLTDNGCLSVRLSVRLSVELLQNVIMDDIPGGGGGGEGDGVNLCAFWRS